MKTTISNSIQSDLGSLIITSQVQLVKSFTENTTKNFLFFTFNGYLALAVAWRTYKFIAHCVYRNERVFHIERGSGLAGYQRRDFSVAGDYPQGLTMPSLAIVDMQKSIRNKLK